MNSEKSASPIHLACRVQIERCSTLEMTRRVQ